MEVALYPFEYMRITQRHDEGNHLPHWNPFKICSDKPWDEALEDGGRGYFAPLNDYRVVEKLGTEKTGFSIRIETVNKVKIPFQKQPVVLELTLTHLNKDDFDKIQVGEILKKGTKKIREGTSGQASGNHFHVTANIGFYHGFKKNGNNKWCFVYDKSLTPDEAFYVDTSKTYIINRKKYYFVGVNYNKGMTSNEIANIDDYLATKIRGTYFGDYTVSAIKVFQEKNNLNVTGDINLETFEKLLDKGAKL